jgi:hypothetical protein
VSKRSSLGANPTEDYMRRLADGLDALSPADRAEVLAEIRGHIVDATAEAGNDESKALAGFGLPEEMATGILRERGVIAENRGLQAAPSWMRWTALAIDIASWLVLLWLLLVVPIGVAVNVGTMAMIAAWAYVAAIAAVTVWWWGWRRRRRGHTSAGMNILGIRRVRVAGAIALVRATDLGAPRRSKGELAGSIAWTAIVALVACAMGYGLIVGLTQNSAGQRQAQVQEVAQDVVEAEQVVDQAYAAVLEGQPASDWFAPQAAAAAAELLARHGSSGFDGHNVNMVQLPDYKNMPSDTRGLERYSLSAIVDVTEIQGNVALGYWEFTVVKRITDVQVSGSATSFSWTWKIERVRLLGNESGA